MSKKNEVPDPLASDEDSGFGVFKAPARKPGTQGSSSTQQTPVSGGQRAEASGSETPTAVTSSTHSVWGGAQPTQPAPTTAPPEEAAALSVDGASHFSPTSVRIGAELAIRFEYFQTKQKDMLGDEPSITAVVMAALQHYYDPDFTQYAEIIQRRRTPPTPAKDTPFGGAVPRRRPGTGSRMAHQLPIRPTTEELRHIDLIWKKVGAQSRSDFLDAVLERFFNDKAVKVPKSFKSKRQMRPPNATEGSPL